MTSSEIFTAISQLGGEHLDGKSNEERYSQGKRNRHTDGCGQADVSEAEQQY
ncbi:MAG: hypothetical protein F6K19_05760 [Cyanothece sp. SIO1E1]|nr:hypothetical protein [Cyanothece sp. SIO1E1]